VSAPKITLKKRVARRRQKNPARSFAERAEIRPS
jgi:hypothetical protein